MNVRRERGRTGRGAVGQGERTRFLGLRRSPVSRLPRSRRHGLRGGLLRLPSIVSPLATIPKDERDENHPHHVT